MVFGVTKALTNYFAGRFSVKFGRKSVPHRGLARGCTCAFPLDVGPVLDVDPHRQRLPRRLIVGGMWTQSLGIVAIGAGSSFAVFALGGVLLGLGTAMVYPTLLAAIGDVAHPSWRASSVGVYRLWRDMGYAFGAILAGIVADAFGLSAATYTIAVLTFASGVVVAVRMRETLRKSLPAETCIEPSELDSGALVIDVREPEEFESGHVEGAINIPVDKLRERIMEIKHRGLVVTACGKGGGRSDRAAQLLRDAGFKDAKALCGGTNAWFDYTKDLT